MTKTIALIVTGLLASITYSIGQLADSAENIQREPLPALVADALGD